MGLGRSDWSGLEGWARGPRKYVLERESRDSTKLFMSSGSPPTCSPGAHCSPVKLTLISVPNIFDTLLIGRSLPRSHTDHEMVTDPNSIVKALKAALMLESTLTEPVV